MAGNTNDTQPGGDIQNTAATSKEAANPFDPSRLRLSQNFSETVGVKKALITVPVRKPNKQEMDKSSWSCPMWQAHIERLEPFEKRRRALETEVPPDMRDRVKSHLQTVRRIKERKR